MQQNHFLLLKKFKNTESAQFCELGCDKAMHVHARWLKNGCRGAAWQNFFPRCAKCFVTSSVVHPDIVYMANLHYNEDAGGFFSTSKNGSTFAAARLAVMRRSGIIAGPCRRCLALLKAACHPPSTAKEEPSLRDSPDISRNLHSTDCKWITNRRHQVYIYIVACYHAHATPLLC